MDDRRFQIRRLHRAGASVQVTIPREMARAIGVAQGDSLYIYVVGQVLCLRRFDEGGFAPGVVAIPGRKQIDIEVG